MGCSAFHKYGFQSYWKLHNYVFSIMPMFLNIFYKIEIAMVGWHSANFKDSCQYYGVNFERPLVVVILKQIIFIVVIYYVPPLC